MSAQRSTASRKTGSALYSPSPMPAYWLPCPVNMNATLRRTGLAAIADQTAGAAAFEHDAGVCQIAHDGNSPVGERLASDLERIGRIREVDCRTVCQELGQVGQWLRRAPLQSLRKAPGVAQLVTAPAGAGGGASSEHDVRVRAADAERADACPARPRRRSAIRSARVYVERVFAKSICGFGALKLRLGGICRCSSASTVLMRPATPAAASRWPMFVFTEPIAHGSRDRPDRPPGRNALVRAAISIGSPSAVPVPCAST